MKKYLAAIVFLSLVVFGFGSFWVWCANNLKEEREDIITYRKNPHSSFLALPSGYFTNELSYKPEKAKVLCVNDQNLKSEIIVSKLQYKTNEIEMKGCKRNYRPVFATDKKANVNDSLTIFSHSDNQLRPGLSKTFMMNGVYSTFKISFEKDLHSNDYIYQVYVSQNGTSQLLTQHYYTDPYEIDKDQALRIEWVGDIDEDGKIDFLISRQIAPSRATLELYVSNNASVGDLVRLFKTQSYNYD